ncbi:MAG TPA: cell division protein FtsZ [Candidatus Methanoculleus thermohydrogenotrophicum]|mgnify:CR=1 FL=1|jgi:cell division protein FtsZ|nr:cell division protein FtsZ [Candidatus Methanoculleus thermohydrogenotrophicum]NLM82877.1 cell division protein FtsZ [Candidatus Methanoculleus thermohydrogenotrophicum]HOB17900.1 cell division protein FtsZ [Candidatus Methanoculleus thermohydrogenotrophicum]HPZ38035.1 cell division protein FtsZ [Candidatus Methanoculleus thermohydrogenotrophicum]HQC91287.1 cell division protein FtsZ [Candidatus Methanoculleus thermohydrogenotrophicum]
MQTIINEALKHAEREKYLKTDSVEDEDDLLGQPRIVIVGCGGAGNNTINRLYHMQVNGAETIAINTDKQHLDMIQADKRVLVGKSLTKGLGAGGFPDVGRRAAEMARPTLEGLLCDADLVFITAGMGGGTGTGTAPVVAQIAKDQGAIVVGMVSYPFQVEKARLLRAEEGLESLSAAADSVIVLDNNRLIKYVPNLPLGQAFSVMDQLIAETVKGISETITEPSLINIDYADVRAIMSKGGVAVMLVGESKQQNKAESVVHECLNHPLLDIDYRGATGSLIHITGGNDLTLQDAEEIASSLTYELDPHADVIWGARVNSDYEGRVRVMAIMTGVKSAQILGSRRPYDPVTQRSDTFNRRGRGRDTPSGHLIDFL